MTGQVAAGTFEFYVAVTTHDLLQQGITCAQWTHVRVAAPNHHDAAQTAIQMGFCVGYATDLIEVL